QRANPRLYDIGCYNDKLALMLTPDSDEVIHLVKESQSKLSDLIKPFDYDKLNSLNAGYESQRTGNVAGARETVGSSMVQKSWIQCYNCKEYGHVAREYQADWKDDTHDESNDQELEAHYMYMAKIQEVSPDVDSGPIFDKEPEQNLVEIVLFIFDYGCSSF
nr:hypothetical protein [Tanacetum cinerariifolium]